MDEKTTELSQETTDTVPLSDTDTSVDDSLDQELDDQLPVNEGPVSTKEPVTLNDLVEVIKESHEARAKQLKTAALLIRANSGKRQAFHKLLTVVSNLSDTLTNSLIDTVGIAQRMMMVHHEERTLWAHFHSLQKTLLDKKTISEDELAATWNLLAAAAKEAAETTQQPDPQTLDVNLSAEHKCASCTKVDRNSYRCEADDDGRRVDDHLVTGNTSPDWCPLKK